MAKRTLTPDDVRKLLSDSSGEARAETAAKLASEFDASQLTDRERQLAEDIFRLMVKDAEVRVRESLATHLKQNPGVPRDVAVALAKDVNSVSLPVLKVSEVLTDEDLIEIITTFNDVAKQMAIANRNTVNEPVSQALVETDNEDVVSTLVNNQGAKISERSFQHVIESLGSHEGIQTAMVRRRKLPIRVAERLVHLVSETLRDELARRHALPANLTTDLILQGRERAVITMSTESDADDVDLLVRELRRNGRLTPSIILRALCMGDIRFFEASMALLAGVPITNARQLIHDAGRLGLKALYEQAGLPISHLMAVRAAILVAKEMEYDGGENDRERFTRKMIERVLTQYGDLGVEFESDDLEYLTGKLSTISIHSGQTTD